MIVAEHAARIASVMQEHPYIRSVSGRQADREALELAISAQLERFRKAVLDEAASKVAHAFRDLAKLQVDAVESERTGA